MKPAAWLPQPCRSQLLVWLLWALCFRAAAGEYLVDVWTSENGLPDSSVTSVEQTPDGYLWAGTYNGVARFDGARFQTFDPANTPALGHARVRKLFVDATGGLWIVCQDGSLTRVVDGRFVLEQKNSRFSDGEMALVHSSTNEIILLDGRGNLYRKPLAAPLGQGWQEIPPPAGRGLGATACADASGGIWYRDTEKKLWRLVNDQLAPLPEDAGLAGQSVNYIASDAHGRVWAATDKGIFQEQQGKFIPYLTVEPVGEEVTFVAPDAKGCVWVVVNGMVGITRDGHWLLPPEAKRKWFAGVTGRIGAQDDGRGGMWFFNYGRGLLHVNGSGEMQTLTTEDGFPGERVYCFFQDSEDNWWAGLDTGGLVRLRERQFHLLPDNGKPLAKAAKSVCEDDQGNFWIGMLGAGLGRLRDETFTNLPLNDSAGGGSVFCVCSDSSGRLWLSAGDEDLYLYEGGQMQRVNPVVHGVKVLWRDQAGHIWVGTTTGLLYCSDPANPAELQPVPSFPRRAVRAISEDAHGALWVGTGSGELFQVASNRVTLFQPSDQQKSGAIWSVLADEDGTIWLGTFRSGLLRFRDGKFTRFDKRDGLSDNVICQILDDRRGNLWVGSHQGIFRVAKSALNDFADGRTRTIPCITYGRSDGLPSLEASGGYQPSACRDRLGRLWFTTAKGATWVQPDAVRLNQQPPPVVIEDVVVDGETKTIGTGEDGLVLGPGRHQIEFRYTGLSLGAAERVQFRYQLAKADADWIAAGTRRAVQYGFLPPGEYEFRVRACNSDGVWNNAGASLRLWVLPHFYETWWFRLLTVLVILLSVTGTVRHLATRRLHRQMEELERKRMLERERARIAKDIHDDLGASLTLIAVLGDLAKKEKTGERIEKMSGTAREAVKSLDEIVWAVNPRNDTLAHLIDYMGQSAVTYLRDAGIRCLLDVPDRAPACEVPTNVRHNVFLVVKEALQNIVKHAHASEVWLHVSVNSQRLRIAVEDNGCGFERAPENAWDDGLRNMRQRLAEVGGDCDIHSELGKGTTISITLPLPAAPA